MFAVAGRCLVRTSLGVALAASLSTTPVALANDADESEVQFRLGAGAYQAGRFEEALAHFLASNRLAPNRKVMRNVGTAYERLGRFPEAYRWYNGALDGETDAASRDVTQSALDRIADKVAVLDITTDPPGASVFVGRVELGSLGTTPVKLALPAGDYTVIVQQTGYLDAQASVVSIKLGERRPVALTTPLIVGTIRAVASEGTEVRLGHAGAPLACTAPCEIEAPPGTATVVFSRPGFRTVVQQAEVAADATIEVNANLLPITGSMVVTTDVPGALVEVDGRAVGYTPTVARDVPVGERKVRITAPGYAPVQRVVDVADGVEVDLRDVEFEVSQVVTAASRASEDISDAPGSVTLISQAELRAFRYSTVAEALRGTRGMATSYDSVYSVVAVRGLGQANDFGNRLLTLQDGAVLNDNVLVQSFAGYDGRSDLGDLERIEVVRGPGSVLYGTGAVSGVVNLVTHATESAPGGHVQVGTADGNVARARAQFKVGDRDMGAWASVSGAQSQGREQAVPTVGPAGNPRGSVDVQGFDAFQAWTINGRAWKDDLTVQWFGHNREISIPTGAYGSALNDSDNRWTDRRWMAELRYEPDISDTVRLETRAYVNNYHFDAITIYGSGEDASLTDERYDGSWGGVEARVISEFSDKVHLWIGGEGQHSWLVRLDGEEVFTDESVPYMDELAPYSIGAGYAILKLRPSERVHLEAAMRADVWSTFGVSLNPRAVAVVRPSDNDVIKVIAGRAFRAPSAYERVFNDGGFAQVRSDFDGTVLTPESVWSGEVELTHKAGERWALVGALWGTQADRLIESVPTSDEVGAPVAYKNIASPIRAYGAEVEVRRQLYRGMLYSANVGVQDARGEGGERSPNVPNVLVGTKLVTPIIPQIATLAARLSSEAPRRIRTQTQETTEWAWLADVVLSGQPGSKGVEYAIGVYNLFDWRYAQPVGDIFQAPVMPQQGRTVRADVGWRF